MKNIRELRLMAVKEHLEKGTTIKELSKKYSIDVARIKYSVSLYKKHGDKPFLDTKDGRLVFTRDKKLEMIKRYLNGESGYSLAIELGTTDQSVVVDWANLYLKGGEEAIKGTKTRKNYVLKDERERIKAQERILKRNEYLEAENEVLKKWYTLILQRSELLKKK